MADTIIQPGDTVRLKSGGPLMTVEYVNKDGGKPRIGCAFYEVQLGGFKTQTFEAPALEKADTGADF